MSNFDPTMDAGFAASQLRIFTAVQAVLPSHTISLVDCSAFVKFGGNTFTGLDPIYGTLASITTISAAFATQAPTLSITFMPPNTSGIVGLNDPLYQGSPVYIWLGLLNEPTGQVVGNPYQLFSGQVDWAQSSFGVGQQTVELSVASVFDRMFVAEEAARLNGQYHKTIHPNETGLDLNVQALAEPYWGMSAPSNPTYPTLPIAPTLGDRLSGQNQGGTTLGNTYGPFGA